MNFNHKKQEESSNKRGEDFIKGVTNYTEKVKSSNTAIDETLGLGKRLYDAVKIILHFLK
ncbi:hypothetical protein [Lachnoclostridium sp.]|uniref:hypothetical protein n=1 Tax=Lachnoclostridium sp. TaxID=2028282 RepID=UPI002896E176|nr:hypothetical protein [Lachnoclostridium sp.]